MNRDESIKIFSETVIEGLNKFKESVEDEILYEIIGFFINSFNCSKNKLKENEFLLIESPLVLDDTNDCFKYSLLIKFIYNEGSSYPELCSETVLTTKCSKSYSIVKHKFPIDDKYDKEILLKWMSE